MGGGDRRGHARRQRNADRRGRRANGAVRVFTGTRRDPLRGRVLLAVADVDRQPGAAGVGPGRHPAVRSDPRVDSGRLAGGVSRAPAAGAGQRRDPDRARRAGARHGEARRGNRRDRGAARRVRGYGKVDPPARSGAARRRGVAGAAGARSHRRAARDSGGAGRRRTFRGDGQDVGGHRARAEEFAERAGHGGRADRPGSRQSGAGDAPASPGRRRDRAAARRGRLAAVVFALAAHRACAGRSGRRRRARDRAAVGAGRRARGGGGGARAVVATHAVRRAQDPGRGREPGQERDRSGQERRGRAARFGKRGNHRGLGRRSRAVCRGARTPVRAVLHHQAERYRVGAADLTPLHRSARRTHRSRDVGHAGRGAVPHPPAAAGGRRGRRQRDGGAAGMTPSVLVIDDEKTFRIVAEEALAAEGFVVTTEATGQAGLAAWQRDPCDVVILDRHLPDTDGIAVLETMAREARERGLDTLIVIATAYADVVSAVQALKLGAFDYLSKPLQLPDLVVTMRKALEAKRLRAQVRQLTGRAQAALGDFVAGPSAAMQRVIDMVDKVAEATETTVLIQGESGTGKELIADLIARRTPRRRDGAFVQINCATVPENLIESELFGHERGAFTDAKTQKRGLFEEADGGTLFLDEVGEMPVPTQAKLLRVLEEMTFRRLGGTRDLSVDVRVVAATNKELADEVERGRFRLDLYHRLDVFHIRVPPLRDRREDILPLASHFLERFAARMRKPAARFAPEVERLLGAYDYPGNVRELRNVIERAVILSTGDIIEPGCIVLSGPTRALPGGGHFFAADLDPAGKPPDLEALERAYIARLLEFAGGNRTQVARLLGVSYPTIAKKIADYGLG